MGSFSATKDLQCALRSAEATGGITAGAVKGWLVELISPQVHCRFVPDSSKSLYRPMPLKTSVVLKAAQSCGHLL